MDQIKCTSVIVLVIYYVKKLRLGIKACKNLWMLHTHPAIVDGHYHTFLYNINLILLQNKILLETSILQL